MELVGVITGVGVFFVIVLVYSVLSSLVVTEPSEIMVISGSSRSMGDRVVGYRWQKGWAVKWPVIEAMHRMDLRNMTIDVTVRNAYSKKGVPLTIEGVANLKVCGHQPLLHNAVERFMAMPRGHIMQIARETLEGNLRGVLATLTPEEVNHDKMKFAESLVEEADKDLQRLGLTLDNLKIQNVSDDVGYLDCIGRKKQADQLRKNKIAEAENRAASAIVEAENRQQKTLIELENRMKVVRAEAETRITDARTRRNAVVAEEQARVAKEIARAEAEIGVYKALIDQVANQLDADVLQPAKAQRQKAIAEAQAAVAPIREAGRATAEMLGHVIDAWAGAGANAREVFRMQKLEGYLSAMLRTVRDVEVDRLTLIGAGENGSQGPARMSLPVKTVAALEQLRGSLGVDVAGAVRSAMGFEPGAAWKPSKPSAPTPAPASLGTVQESDAAPSTTPAESRPPGHEKLSRKAPRERPASEGSSMTWPQQQAAQCTPDTGEPQELEETPATRRRRRRKARARALKRATSNLSEQDLNALFSDSDRLNDLVGQFVARSRGSSPHDDN